uniref:Ig-like domain-containing protein n=1 Tax=Callorhinchus milii TaxID=7868 RepID=A0A4W3H4U5_CALMI
SLLSATVLRFIDSSKSLTLVCETAEFYPGDVTLTWNKAGSEVKTGIHFSKENNSKGLYEVSSSMEETEPIQSGAVYTCLVSHPAQTRWVEWPPSVP